MQVHAVDCANHVAVRKAITRERFVNRFANLEPCGCNGGVQRGALLGAQAACTRT